MNTTREISLATVMPVALVIGIAHVIIGLCILFEPRALLVTSMVGVSWITSIFANGGWVGGALLIAAGGAAVWGGCPWCEPTGRRLKLITPQVILLVFTIASVIGTAVAGHYPDDYVPEGGWMFIVADQALAAAVATFHVVTVLLLPLGEERLATA